MLDVACSENLPLPRGELEIPIGKRLPLSQVREAHRLAERGIDGKVLLTM